MSDAARRAGNATLADGTEVVWSVADGRRGRRWRAMTRRDGAIGSSLLLEVAPDGRPVRLELATATGLLTLHPEPTGLLHGNVVTSEGVRHLALAWSDDHELEVEPRGISCAITARRLGGSVSVGEGTEVRVVAVDGSLGIREETRRYERLAAMTWRIVSDGETRTLTVDDRGLPVWPAMAGDSAVAGEWPLELDPQD